MAISRRSFIQMLGVSLLTPFTLKSFAGTAGKDGYASFVASSRPFTAGYSDWQRVFSWSVASGDPCDSGVVLWTRINPDAYRVDMPLYFEVSEDEYFQTLVVEAEVSPKDFGEERDFTVNLDLEGLLKPAKTYYYRFIYDGAESRTGRCKTLPEAGSYCDQARFAILTCQDYTTGFYNAFNHLADEDIDFVVHLGDFIYEYDQYPGFANIPRSIELPSGEKVASTLEDYRAIYRTFRTDPHLQRAMENHTWIITWDDHETADNAFWDYERDTLGLPHHDERRNDDAESLRTLKRAAQKAWIEYIPARVQVNESAIHAFDYLKLYRKFEVGDLLELYMTDSRTYRTEEPCKGGTEWENYWCVDYKNSSQTMLGHEQRDWLINGMKESEAKWQVWGNQTLLAQLAATVLGEQIAYANYDAWDGYQHERETIMRELKDNDVSNLVVLTGDMHTCLTSYLKIDYGNIFNWDYRNLVGVELMTPSVTSPNLSDNIKENLPINSNLKALMNGAAQVNNPHIKDFNSSIYGYSIIDFKRNTFKWTVYNIDKAFDNPNTKKHTYKTFKYNARWMWLYEV